MKYPPSPGRLNCLHKWNQIQVSGLSSGALLQCCFLGEGLQRRLNSHPRAGKAAAEIQTWSFPTRMFLDNPGRIPRARMGFCRNNCTHHPLQSVAVISNAWACCPWHTPVVSLRSQMSRQTAPHELEWLSWQITES